MPGFMADFEADLAAPFGVARLGARGALLFDTGYVTSGTSIQVPVGATYCEAITVGGGGSGAGDAATTSNYSNGGSGAYARSGFTVTPGSIVSYVRGAGGAGVGSGNGNSGSWSSVSYNGVFVALADSGSGGIATGVAIGSPGQGGKAANCIGNIDIKSGASSGSATGPTAGSGTGPSPITSTGGVTSTTPTSATNGGGGGQTLSGNGSGNGGAGVVILRFFAS